MAFADDMRTLARSVRAIPGQLGIRVHRAWLVESEFSGAYTGDGSRTDTDLEITEGDGQPPRIRWLTAEQLTVGGLDAGTVEIGPITSAGGVTLGDVGGDELSIGGMHLVRIVGPMHLTGAHYRITKKTLHRAFHWMLQAKPVEAIE